MPNFVKNTGLSWKIIRVIAQYLSLNDAISAFSIHIYPLLTENQSEFELSNPCDSFIKIILSKIKSEQIISLQFNTNRLWSKTELTFLSKFKEVRSIKLHNVLQCDQIEQYKGCFPNLTRVCFYYDNKTDYLILSNVANQISSKTRRLEIHYPGIFCTDRASIEEIKKRYWTATKVESFLLNVDYYPSTSTSNRLEERQSGFIIPIADFMKQMPSARDIHIIINDRGIEHFVDDYQWELVVAVCSQLIKIKLQMPRNTCQNQRLLMKKALEIQTILRTKRQTIQYEISFL